MRVILAMARITILGQRDLGDVPGRVARLAIKPAMRTGQRVARLRIVIKAPSRPAVRIMAERAVRPQPAFVMLVPVA